MGQVLFVTGGARSGKSAFAEHLAVSTGAPVTYVATLEPLDGEMVDRIARHRERRPDEWETVEAPRDLAPALWSVEGDHCVLIDCLSVWLANHLLTLGDTPTAAALDGLERDLDRAIESLVAGARARDGTTVIVSNETGSGVVPAYALGRAYRDLLGRQNQRCSRAADRAWLVVAGRALELPPPWDA